MNLTHVAEGTRWPSGEAADLALIPLTEEELFRRVGMPRFSGFEHGWGEWVSTGGRLPCGAMVEFIHYTSAPGSKGFILRTDMGACLWTAFVEALQVVGLSREEIKHLSPHLEELEKQNATNPSLA